MQKDYGKAFLTHNRIENLRQNPDPDIINSLLANAGKENDQTLLTQLYELKGTYYLRMNNFAEAAKWFAKVPESYSLTHYKYDYETEKYIPTGISSDDFNGYSEISPLIFSNGFKRLFSVPAASQLTDVMYEQYPYLNKEHNKATLTAALMQLEKESQMMTEKAHGLPICWPTIIITYLLPVITEIFLHTSQTTPTIGLHTSHTAQQAQTPFLITAKSIITETSPRNI